MSIFSQNIMTKEQVKSALLLEQFANDYAKRTKKSQCFSEKRMHEICNEAIMNNRTFIDGVLWEEAASDVQTIIDSEIV